MSDGMTFNTTHKPSYLELIQDNLTSDTAVGDCLHRYEGIVGRPATKDEGNLLHNY
jgi:hypothetical protein